MDDTVRFGPEGFGADDFVAHRPSQRFDRIRALRRTDGGPTAVDIDLLDPYVAYRLRPGLGFGAQEIGITPDIPSHRCRARNGKSRDEVIGCRSAGGFSEGLLEPNG